MTVKQIRNRPIDKIRCDGCGQIRRWRGIIANAVWKGIEIGSKYSKTKSIQFMREQTDQYIKEVMGE